MTPRHWPRRPLLVLLVWGIGVAAATAMSALPTNVPTSLALIAPVLAVFLIGVHEADHWWTRSALLIAAPPAMVALLVGVGLLLSPERSSQGYGFMELLTVAVASFTVALAVASVVIAALGVWFGRWRAKEGWQP